MMFSEWAESLEMSAETWFVISMVAASMILATIGLLRTFNRKVVHVYRDIDGKKRVGLAIPLVWGHINISVAGDYQTFSARSAPNLVVMGLRFTWRRWK